MNLAGSLIKQVLVLQDAETWSYLRKAYLPSEYHSLFNAIENHSDRYQRLPSLEDLKLSVRDAQTREKVYALEGLDVEVEPFLLLEYLKNEFTQREILSGLDGYIDNSVSFENAEESLEQLYQVIVDVEDKVDLEVPTESMQRITLFEDDEEIARYLPLGLNSDFDHKVKFSPRDLILLGGYRGAGKSITCANLANNVYASGRSAIYFTIEMDSRNTLQRHCAIATGVPFSRLRTKTLGVGEWDKVASWWAERFINGADYLKEYRSNHNFDEFHHKLTTKCELDPVRQLDIVYDPSLTIGKIRSEVDKKMKQQMDVGIIVVDYLNQVKRGHGPSRNGQYDWTEQIEVSKALKSMAQEYEVPVFAPYQADNTGEARFAKGILDAADAAFALDAYEGAEDCITYKCVKMRNAAMNNSTFTSKMDWETLKVGPESALTPEEREKAEHKTGEDIDDLDGDAPF